MNFIYPVRLVISIIVASYLLHENDFERAWNMTCVICIIDLGLDFQDSNHAFAWLPSTYILIVNQSLFCKLYSNYLARAGFEIVSLKIYPKYSKVRNQGGIFILGQIFVPKIKHKTKPLNKIKDLLNELTWKM